MNNGNIYTDLACERRRADTKTNGVTYKEINHGEICESILGIESDEGASSIGKEIGEYITLSFERIWRASEELKLEIENLLYEKLLYFIHGFYPDRSIKNIRALIIGLGNSAITSDALGPMTVKAINPTSHILKYEPKLFEMLDCGLLSAIAPGVMAQTGIEALEIARGAALASGAEIIIAIDALVARSRSRLACTIQISNTGIDPGSGVGNHRKGINKESLGIPVISIGVPTVVNCATLIQDFIDENSIKASIKDEESFFVSPKEADVITEYTAKIISGAINSVFEINI